MTTTPYRSKSFQTCISITRLFAKGSTANRHFYMANPFMNTTKNSSNNNNILNRISIFQTDMKCFTREREGRRINASTKGAKDKFCEESIFFLKGEHGTKKMKREKINTNRKGKSQLCTDGTVERGEENFLTL